MFYIWRKKEGKKIKKKKNEKERKNWNLCFSISSSLLHILPRIHINRRYYYGNSGNADIKETRKYDFFMFASNK